MAACPSCGSENAATAKFCSECGTALGVAAARGREERKVVSVVFVDLVGSTARAESSDPEDVRALLRVYHERARDELESFGGTVEKFIGDAVVAVFGAPVSHEDDPERAVRAALAVRDAVGRMNEEAPERDLHVRIAVNTGEALVSLDASPGEGEAMVAGDVVNTAARIQSAAPVDGILVGEQTYGATDRQIVYRDADAIDAKGKSDRVRVWEALEARSSFGVDLGGAGRTALIGRDRELDLLVDALTRSRRDRSTQLVTLVGVPGIGKSRLVFELRRAVDADDELITWRQGRCLPYGEGVSYWALGEIVKAQSGILESDGADATAAKLSNAVSVLADDGERTWVERHLRPLVGLGSDELTGDQRGEAFAAWRRFIEAVAEGGPAVLVFEDLHWADDGMLDFVDNLVDWVDGVPLLVMCTARPELLTRRPGWGGGKRNATTVSLSPLADADTASLVLALLDRPLLDAEAQQALVARAAGNPLYAEEFVRILEAGANVDTTLPDTIQGIVAARLDLLPPAEKELLQNAAVLGKVFWSDALGAVGAVEPWMLDETLRSLERKEFIRREQRSAIAGASQHAFVHALVRDTTYGQLPRASRASRHMAAATWIESLPDDRAEDRAETLAHHYLTAIELYRAAGEDVAHLAARAVPALTEAGERSLALSAHAAAARFLSLALELVPEGQEPAPELLLAAGAAFDRVGRAGDELARAVAAFERAGDPERAAEAATLASRHAWHSMAGDADAWLERAALLVEHRPASRAKALVVAGQARRDSLAFRPESGLELAESAVALAREIEDVKIEADALVTLGCARVALGDPGGVESIEGALELVGHRGGVAARAYVNLGWAYSVIGDIAQALRVAEEAVERGEREGDIQDAWFSRGNLVNSLYDLGRWDEAVDLIASFADAPDGARYQLVSVRSVQASVLAARDRPDEALEVIREVVTLARPSMDPQALWPSMVVLSRLARERGLRTEAESALDEVTSSIAASESAGDVQQWHVELVLLLVVAGCVEDATAIVGRLAAGVWRDACSAVLEERYAEAADILERIGEQPLQALLRLHVATTFVTEDRLIEAQAQLERACAFWRTVGATAYLRDVDQLLAAAG
ncbi:MAG TPA: adenylate/guanylate cyclase domain-containing protein [Gaiellaceae bacterium]|nr:adenylate/guanylate cyclase domain-containing protein [Gaiellaceae bacterium]